jgi:bifunctional UDP-N-acetylglucosamine pyrophosphorylase/glucosamine-1-phosphate N-acetyltransferase
MERTCLAVILAAGDGTRMKSAKSKVLHPVAGRPMIAHVVEAVANTGVSSVALVVGRDAEEVAGAARIGDVGIETYLQKERLGTGHAVLAARDAIARGYDDILVTYGDVPLQTEATLKAARQGLAEGSDIVVIGFHTARPTGYGRLLVTDGELVAIREEKDASEDERKITWCNSGLMAINGRKALDLLSRIGNGNAKGEYYLTDLVEIARSLGGRVTAVDAPEIDMLGCNNRAELAVIERFWQERRRRALMLDGVTMIAPETVFLCHDTVIGQDALIEPNVVFGPGTVIEGGAVVHAFSHIEGAHVRAGATVGPFARLRPGAEIAEAAHIGNFVEIKNAHVEAGAKANHLAYIGDGRVGEGANVGAGTIFCNYDGAGKHFTDVGKGAFIGSNSALVAPVKIGDGAYVGSGSVITRDVEPDALALERTQQTVLPGWAARFRKKHGRK